MNVSKEIDFALKKLNLNIPDNGIQIKVIDHFNLEENKEFLKPFFVQADYERDPSLKDNHDRLDTDIKLRYFNRIEDGIAIVAVKDGKPIGITLVEKYTFSPSKGRKLATELIHILPEYRRLGLSKKLARKAMYIIKALEKGHETQCKVTPEAVGAYNSRLRIWKRGVGPLPKARFVSMKKEDYIKRAKKTFHQGFIRPSK